MPRLFGQALKPGDPAPELVSVSAQGEERSLSDLSGHPVLVSFLSHAA